MGKIENTLKHTILKTIETHGKFEHFETHHLKTIETYGEIWKHFETHNLKSLKPMGKFENTLKHIVSLGEAFYGLGTASSIHKSINGKRELLNWLQSDFLCTSFLQFRFCNKFY